MLSIVFPTLNALTGARHGHPGLLRRPGGGRRDHLHRRLVPVRHQRRSVLVPDHQHRRLLESVPGGLSAAERVFALIDAEPVVRQNAQRPAPPLRGEITFDHLNFRYHARGAVLNDFSLHIRAGETLALVGHTGAGKSASPS